MLKVKLPKGTYYIGDPCYITKGELGFVWIEKLWDKFYHHNDKNGLITIDGVDIFIQNTYDGDGQFDGFYCDSGTLCVLRIDDIISDPRFNFNNMNIKGAKFVNFSDDIIVTYEKGDFNINNEIIIKTSF